MITQDRLKEEVYYDPATGIFTWRKTRSGRSNRTAGRVQRGRKGDDYVNICIDYKRYPAHRLAWVYMTGEPWPEIIDHANGDGTDNRWDNLRACDSTLNSANRRVLSGKKLPKGVSLRSSDCPREKKFRATICREGQRKHLGYFYTAEEAAIAYQNAARAAFGKFASWTRGE